MNEATNDENSPMFSMADSSRLSGSTGEHSSNNRELEIEQLRRQLREAQSENLELKRALPQLQDINGRDCREWAVKSANELEDQKEKYRQSQDQLAAVARQYREFRDNAEQAARHSKQMLAELRAKALELEEENKKLRDQLRDEESLHFHLQRGDLAPGRSAGGRNTAEGGEEEQFEEALRHIDQRSENDVHSGRSTAQRTDRSFRAPDPALEAITQSLFNKLRSSADFFMDLLGNIGDEAQQQQDRQLVERIKNLQLDLNHSIQMYNKRVEELRRSAPSSVENSFRFEDRATSTSNQPCSKCKLVESERDTLRAQLNREIALKEEYLEGNEELEKNLREMRRQMEEMRSELQQSRARVDDIERKLKRTEDYYQSKYGGGGGGRQSAELAELNEKIRQMRQRNLELDAKNEEILKAVRRFKELNQEEMNNKDIELQRHMAALEEHERRHELLEGRCRRMEEAQGRLQEERQFHLDKRIKLEEELDKRDALLRKYARKVENLRKILASYGHYFDHSVDFEGLVEQSTEVLEGKVADGKQTQRTVSSASQQIAMATGDNQREQQHNGKETSLTRARPTNNDE